MKKIAIISSTFLSVFLMGSGSVFATNSNFGKLTLKAEKDYSNQLIIKPLADEDYPDPFIIEPLADEDYPDPIVNSI
jgi:hypothetical protein